MKLFFIAFLILLSNDYWSQMGIPSNQWSSNLQFFNPAITALYPKFEVRSQYRMQWVGFDGAPKTSRISVSAPLVKKTKLYEWTRHGIGCSIENDKLAAFSLNKFQFQYGVHFRLKHKHRMSFGLGVGAYQMGYNPNEVTTYYPDPSVKTQSNFVKPLIDVGAIFSGERYIGGISVKHFLPSKWDKIGLNSNFNSEVALFGKYAFSIHEHYDLIPSVLVSKTLNAPLLLDASLKLNYLDRILTFVGCRFSRSFYVGMEFLFTKKWGACYSFEYGTNPISEVLLTSHEFGISFKLPNTVIEPGYKYRTAF